MFYMLTIRKYFVVTSKYSLTYDNYVLPGFQHFETDITVLKSIENKKVCPKLQHSPQYLMNTFSNKLLG